jgi:NAD+ synthetase
VLAAKVGRLSAWFTRHDLDAAVVGVSGGIDSAVTLALLHQVASRPGSPLQRVVAAIIPIDADGATGQAAASGRARAVADAVGAEAWEIPFAEVQHAATLALEKGSGLAFDGWAAGQLLSTLRTPALYGAVALLQVDGRRPVVVGTTNRDEGAYLGFFGKASDAMVDLQPLSDLHKSEVRALARELAVPAAVVDAAPSGDVWDGRTDAEMIGVGYDDVELVLRLRELGLDPCAVAVGLADGADLVHADRAVERLHRVNAHKYAVGSPAVHLDVLPRAVPGGWDDEVLSGRGERRPVSGIGPGEWVPPPLAIERRPAFPARQALVGGAVLARDVLSDADCDRLIEAMRAHADPVPVGVTGVRSSAGIGSVRATAWSPELADQLWTRVRLVAPSMRFLDPTSPTDGHATADRTGHRTWRVVGLSPVLRFMRYERGGRHLTHHDAGFDYGDGRRTLVSVVLYLTGDPDRDDGAGGATRLVRDGQEHLAVWDRDLRDWDRDTRPDEVLVAVRPERGAALLFDHGIGHDVERWEGPSPRIVIRADVVYEAVPDGQTLP